MTFGIVKRIGNVTLLLALLAGLSSCGRRGSLEAPSSGNVVSEQGEQAPAPEKTPDREFILDALI